jgi:hypothetical protein
MGQYWEGVISEINSGTLMTLKELHCERSFIVQSPEKPSLYDRLGGVYSIATVVDDLIDRLPPVHPLKAVGSDPDISRAHGLSSGRQAE